ncbi:MAG: CRISPR-associated protein Csx3 [Candidatus Brocadia sp.]
MPEHIIDISQFFSERARLAELDVYIQKAKELAGEGNDVILTGAGPVWLYLKIAHGLHGKAKSLRYRSPVTGDVLIFDHSP